MDSNNWRMKRGPDASVSVTKSNTVVEKSWGEMPGYIDRKPQYYGGRNPTRGSREPFRRPTKDIAVDPKAHHAIDEGRRVYVGNLLYKLKLDDIRSIFADLAESIEDISMSIDPMTGRNPSYCFIDFVSRDIAERVILDYDRVPFKGRPLKVRPGVKSGKSTQSYRFHLKEESLEEDPQKANINLLTKEMRENPMAFNRWRRLDEQFDTEKHNDAATQEGRRLYVGGLPRFMDQVTANLQIQDLFSGYKVEVVSKMISPHSSLQESPGNNYYCFVDLATENEATQAILDLNGMEKWNWNIKVSRASGKSGKLHERQRIYVGGLPQFKNEKALQMEMKTLFEEFGEVKVVSKLFEQSDDPTRLGSEPRNNYHYCFVEFADGKQADAAIEALDYKEKWDFKIRVKPANPSKRKGGSCTGSY